MVNQLPASTAARPTPRHRSAAREGNPEPPWTPKMWSGMTFGAWLQLLARNRFAIAGRRLPMALAITLFTVSNSLLSAVQQLVHGRRVAQTPMPDDPIFVIGHWRSGTTFLHELLARDPRHTYPTTFECYSPNHFLLTEKMATRWLRFLLPAKRLQDDVPLAWDRPQEDEFALCNLGARSPFLTVAFPNRPPADTEYLDLEGLPSVDVEQWTRTFTQFLRQITYLRPRRIVLKSPQHTCRIAHLLRIFPNARFVYIVRNPCAVVPSTTKLWRILYASQGLQVPLYHGLEEHVLTTFLHLYRSVERARNLVPPGRFCEVRYEDLVADPRGRIRAIYDQVELGDFEAARPHVEEYLQSVAGYQPSHHEVPPSLQTTIAGRLGPFLAQYGYQCRPDRPA